MLIVVVVTIKGKKSIDQIPIVQDPLTLFIFVLLPPVTVDFVLDRFLVHALRILAIPALAHAHLVFASALALRVLAGTLDLLIPASNFALFILARALAQLSAFILLLLLLLLALAIRLPFAVCFRLPFVFSLLFAGQVFTLVKVICCPFKKGLLWNDVEYDCTSLRLLLASRIFLRSMEELLPVTSTSSNNMQTGQV